MFTQQETLDMVIAKAKIQNAQSIDHEGTCLYRSKAGACFAGFLFTDEEYNEDLEHKGVTNLQIRGSLPPSLHKHDLPFVQKLQEIHDGHPPKEWSSQFRLLAEREGLVSTW